MVFHPFFKIRKGTNMLTITVSDVTYRIKFGYNCFCDGDIFDRVKDILGILSGAGAEDDDDVSGLGKIRDLFATTRELLYLGLKKYNPVDSLTEVGDLLDTYRDEAPEGEKRGLLQIFTLLSEELMSEGFLSDLAVEMKNVKTPKRKK